MLLIEALKPPTRYLTPQQLASAPVAEAAEKKSLKCSRNKVPGPICGRTASANRTWHLPLYLVVNEGGRIYVPRLKPNSTIYYDGSTADLYLEPSQRESGERVLIRSDRENYLNTYHGAR